MNQTNEDFPIVISFIVLTSIKAEIQACYFQTEQSRLMTRENVCLSFLPNPDVLTAHLTT